MTEFLQRLKEVFNRRETNAPLAEGAAADDIRLQLPCFAEIKRLAHADLASRTNQAFPFIGILTDLASDQHLDPATQKITGGRIVRT